MHKFFVDSNQIDENIIKINGTDVNHIKNVLRLKADEQMQICNKQTSENYIVKIVECSNEEVTCQIVEKVKNSIETEFDIDIYQGLPKFDKMELIIQKTTELGVKKIIPVDMKRCVVKLNEKDANKKIERWQKIAEIAAKQSKRDYITRIENLININKICERINEYDLFLVAYEDEEETTLKSILKENLKAKKIGILIGPEGGIDIKEVNKLKESGAKIVTLGKRILRTETAPIVMSANIIYELEN